ncbi:MAG: response regulator [Deltaproteobacteria bacterium]|nr:response regulator [Deltaproteobacteria bacterium]
MRPRILVVDDEEEFAGALAERLTIREYDVATSFTGQDALAKINEHNYDIIILDVKMPGVSGIDVLKEIKSIKPLTEVIMLTGNATVETAIEGMKLGAYDYLMKPCETDDLTEKINRAYKKKTEHEERIREARIKEIISSPRSAFHK